MTPESFRNLPPETVERLADVMSRLPHLTDEEEAFVASLMPDAQNPCGDCTLCCSAPSIEAKNITSPLTEPKPAGEMCQYCDGSGCRVYANRPGVCKSYMCFYTLGLLNTSPLETGVCWSPQPPAVDVPGMPEAWIAVGHTHDASAAMSSMTNIEDVIHLLNMGAVMAIIRDTKQIIQFVNPSDAPLTSGSTLITRATPVDPADPMKQDWLPDNAVVYTLTLA